jgi:transcriptional regulator of arginine metabolism
VSKTFRQEQILKLIRSRPVHSQQELADALHRAGVDATQVTLSRDLKELGLVKTAAGYVEIDHAPGAPAAPVPEIGHILRDFVRDVRRAQNLLVIKTDAGAAQTVGASIDNENWDELVGSLAGDDTVLLICEDSHQCGALERRLKSLLSP